jgi:hypothetical protein
LGKKDLGSASRPITSSADALPNVEEAPWGGIALVGAQFAGQLETEEIFRQHPGCSPFKRLRFKLLQPVQGGDSTFILFRRSRALDRTAWFAVVAGSVQAHFQKNMQQHFLFEADQHRVALFLMDYPTRTRLKLLGLARVLDAREHPPSITTRFTAAQDAKVCRTAEGPHRWVGIQLAARDGPTAPGHRWQRSSGRPYWSDFWTCKRRSQRLRPKSLTMRRSCTFTLVKMKSRMKLPHLTATDELGASGGARLDASSSRRALASYPLIFACRLRNCATLLRLAQVATLHHWRRWFFVVSKK